MGGSEYWGGVAHRVPTKTRDEVRGVLSPLRLPFRHGPEAADSTGDAAILEAVTNKDCERLGVLLGVADLKLGAFVAAWPSLSPEVRQALFTLAKGVANSAIPRKKTPPEGGVI